MITKNTEVTGKTGTAEDRQVGAHIHIIMVSVKKIGTTPGKR